MTAAFVDFAGGGGRPMQADLYRPAGDGPHPVIVAVPGGAWIRGHRAALAGWGRHLAAHGVAVLAIDYRRATDGPVFPGNVEDVAGALRWVADHGASAGLDPARMVLMGASAGAHLAALALLSDAYDTPAVRALVGVYGVYDLVAHWQDSRAANTARGEDAAERMLGCDPFEDQGRYFAASPLRHITYAKALPTLLIWGAADRDVPPAQSDAFARALQQARFPLRTLVLPDAGHLWFSEDPIDDPFGHTARVAPLLTRFVAQAVGARPTITR